MRRARVDDAAAIGEIHVLAWRAAYVGQLPDDFLRGLSVADRQQAWRQRLAEPKAADVLVVEQHARVAGFAVVGPSRDQDAGTDTAELQSLYLHPTHWNRGLGRALHDHALGVLTGHGYRHATLWVLTGNARARRFYERAGWRQDLATKTDTIGDTGIELEEVRYERRFP